MGRGSVGIYGKNIAVSIKNSGNIISSSDKAIGIYGENSKIENTAVIATGNAGVGIYGKNSDIVNTNSITAGDSIKTTVSEETSVGIYSSGTGNILNNADITVGKNYLSEKEIRQLERAVAGYFDYIEDLIERENTFTMQDFATSINEFLAFRKYDILTGKGRISKKQADEKAKAEYDEFNKTQKINSDFEKQVKQLLEKGGAK